MKKKWLIALIAAIIAVAAFGLAGCRSDEQSEEADRTTTEYESTSVDEKETTSQKESPASKDESGQGNIGSDEEKEGLATDVSAFEYSITGNEVCITKLKDTSLTEIVIPSEIEGYLVTSIGAYAFYECSSLSSIELPEGITSIGESLFTYCSSLSSIELPESVTSIGDYAFYKCSSLSSIELPESVTSIGNRVFYGCSSLTTIIAPSGSYAEGWATSNDYTVTNSAQ